uniref:Nuclear valosin-containing protein-like n=1 Tax=Saccoglossus kowalevskii TaxID=10224 RepID=A0ABM0MC40_SACKO|nr:PREDICTED: nuclear valosin-containing protein-like [Saccoglossus kowalevskii]
MGKKSRSTSSTPSKQQVYIGDRQLLKRVELYLSSQSHMIDIDCMVQDLQRTYCEYMRRKKNVFRRSVQRVYDWLKSEAQRKESIDIDELEDEHISKRLKKDDSSDDSGEESDIEFSPDNQEYVETQDTNMVNISLTNLYQQKTQTPDCHSTFIPPHGTDSTNNPKDRLYFLDTKGDHCPSEVPAIRTEEGRKSDDEEKESDHSRNVNDNIMAQEESQPKETKMSDMNVEKEKSGKRKRKSLSVERDKNEKKQRLLTEGRKSKKKGVELQNSTVSFEDIGGNEHNIQEICKLLVHMRHPEELDLPFLKIAAPEIVSGVSGESEENIRDLFEKAVLSAPCIVFIDEIDAITPKRETAQREMERRIVAQLLTCMDELSTSAAQVLVIGATNRADSLEPALRRAGRFDREISLGIPDEESRKRIMQVLCKSLKLSEDFDFSFLASQTPGYVGADLMSLCREAAMCAVNRAFDKLESKQDSSVSVVDENASDKDVKSVLSWLRGQPPLTEEQLQDLYINIDDFKVTLPLVQPSAKREGFVTIPDVTWNDIGALEAVRDELSMAILAPVRNPVAFKALGLNNPPGILLAGPPGCGKTLLAKAIANESGINFISVKGPELLNMYVGESERAVRQCFQRARNSAPCVIFFDELDALCPRRANVSESGSSARVVNQLLTEMDGLESRKQVFIMGATNRPDIIDPAVLRPGRLDKILYVGIPSQEDRIKILTTITKNGTKPCLAANVHIVNIAEDSRCEGFTGADLAALVREASMSALKKILSTVTTDTPSNPASTLIEVDNTDFDIAFTKVKPSVSVTDKKMYEKMKCA